MGQFIRRKSHMCSVCNFSFSLKSSLEIQSESVNENKKSFKCSFCDYCCPKKCDLQKHTESAHDKCKLQKCSICDFNCSQKVTQKFENSQWIS